MTKRQRRARAKRVRQPRFDGNPNYYLVPAPAPQPMWWERLWRLLNISCRSW